MTRKQIPRCRNCAYMRVVPNAKGQIRPRKGERYLCIAPIPNIKDLYLPSSITEAYDFRWPPARTRVDPEDGENCPMWTLREVAP